MNNCQFHLTAVSQIIEKKAMFIHMIHQVFERIISSLDSSYFSTYELSEHALLVHRHYHSL